MPRPEISSQITTDKQNNGKPSDDEQNPSPVAYMTHDVTKLRQQQADWLSSSFQNRGGREDETDARAEHQTHQGASQVFFFSGSSVFFWLVAAWVKSRAERPSVSVVNRQLHVQIGCKLGIRNRKDELEASKAKQITN